jgi:hypothetical protein
MTDPLQSTVVLARLAMLGTLFFAVVMYVAFVFIQPDLNPIYRFGSEYSVGRLGWLMKLAFFVWGGGQLALALAMAKGLDAESRSNAAPLLFVVGGVGIFLSGVFDSDLQVLNENPPPLWVEPPPSDEEMLHSSAGLVGLLSLMAAAGFATRRLRLAGRLGSAYRTLRFLSWLTPAAFVAFALFFTSYGLPGLGQRIFLALMFAWQIIAAHGLATGAFSLRQ